MMSDFECSANFVNTVVAAVSQSCGKPFSRLLRLGFTESVTSRAICHDSVDRTLVCDHMIVTCRDLCLPKTTLVGASRASSRIHPRHNLLLPTSINLSFPKPELRASATMPDAVQNVGMALSTQNAIPQNASGVDVFRFLDLPRELRNRIYSMLTYTSPGPRTIEHNREYCHMVIDPVPYTRLRYVSRQFKEEYDLEMSLCVTFRARDWYYKVLVPICEHHSNHVCRCVKSPAQYPFVRAVTHAELHWSEGFVDYSHDLWDRKRTLSC